MASAIFERNLVGEMWALAIVAIVSRKKKTEILA